MEGPNRTLIPMFWTHIRGDGIIPPVRCFGCGGQHQRLECRHQSDSTAFTQMCKDCGTRHPCLDCPSRNSFGIFSQSGVWNKSCPQVTNYLRKSRKIQPELEPNQEEAPPKIVQPTPPYSNSIVATEKHYAKIKPSISPGFEMKQDRNLDRAASSSRVV